MPKIAICFSGGIRDLHVTLPSIKMNFIDSLKNSDNEVDIFMYLTYLRDASNIENKFKFRESCYNENLLIETLKPKKYVIKEYTNELQKEESKIDNFDLNVFNFDNISDVNKNYIFNSFGMYSKINKCDKLRQEYQKENNFTYDFIWRARLDAVFYEPITHDTIKNYTDKNMYFMRDRYSPNNGNTNDKFFGGNDKIMRELASVYYELPKMIIHYNIFNPTDTLSKKINILKENGIIQNINYVGHRNIYNITKILTPVHFIIPYYRKNYKLNISKIIYLNIKDESLLHDIGYKLLSFSKNFVIHANKNDEILKIFNTYHVTKINTNRTYDYFITDGILDIKTHNTIFLRNLNNNNIDNHDSTDSNIENVKKEKNICNFYYSSEKNISDIILSFVLTGKYNYKYVIDNTDIDPEIDEDVEFKLPNRSIHIGKVTDIKLNKNNEKIYKINCLSGTAIKHKYNVFNYYKRNEIRIIDYNKYLHQYE